MKITNGSNSSPLSEPPARKPRTGTPPQQPSPIRRPGFIFNELDPRGKSPRSNLTDAHADLFTPQQKSLQDQLRAGFYVTSQAMRQADEIALKTALQESLKQPTPHGALTSAQQFRTAGAMHAGPRIPQGMRKAVNAMPKTSTHKNEQHFAADMIAMSGLQARIVSAVDAGHKVSPVRIQNANDAALAAGIDESLKQSVNAMNGLQARIVSAMNAGHKVSPVRIQNANDAAFAAGIDESLKQSANAMNGLQARIMSAVDAGHKVSPLRVQSANDAALAVGIDESLKQFVNALSGPQARIVSAMDAGHKVSPLRIQNANDAALAAGVDESLN